MVSYVFLLPFLIVFGIFLAYPIFYSMWLSVNRVSWTTDLFNCFTTMKFVGFGNYLELLQDPRFWWSLLMTFYYAALCIPFSVLGSLLLAVVMNQKLQGVKFFRTAYFLPNVLDMLVVGIIWVFIYSPHYGILDRFLSSLGITYFSQTGILGNPRTAMLGVAFAVVLKGLGFGMILFLAAIQNIPTSVYEAADIDGANAGQKFWLITLPLVKPIVLFLSITGMIQALNAFAEFFAMTSGRPYAVVGGVTQGMTRVTGYYLFENWQTMRYGYTAAISFVLLLVTLGISYANARALRTR